MKMGAKRSDLPLHVIESVFTSVGNMITEMNEQEVANVIYS